MTALLSAGWTWIGPLLDEDGGYELRIKELPDYFVAGQSADEVIVEARAALRSFLQSYLDHDQALPVPPDRWRLFLGAAADEMPPPLEPSEAAQAHTAIEGLESIRLQPAA